MVYVSLSLEKENMFIIIFYILFEACLELSPRVNNSFRIQIMSFALLYMHIVFDIY